MEEIQYKSQPKLRKVKLLLKILCVLILVLVLIYLILAVIASSQRGNQIDKFETAYLNSFGEGILPYDGDCFLEKNCLDELSTFEDDAFNNVNSEVEFGSYHIKNGELIADTSTEKIEYKAYSDERIHAKIWSYVYEFYPEDISKNLYKLRYYTDGYDESEIASISEINYPCGALNLSIDIVDFAAILYLEDLKRDTIRLKEENNNDIDYLLSLGYTGDNLEKQTVPELDIESTVLRTLIHESAHIISFSGNQVNQSLCTANDPSSEILRGIIRLGSCNVTTSGSCITKESYLYNFRDLFWSKYPFSSSSKYDKAEREELYPKHTDQFFTEYSTKNAEEDFAESLVAAVIGVVEEDKPILKQKIDFFIEDEYLNSIVEYYKNKFEEYSELELEEE